MCKGVVSMPINLLKRGDKQLTTYVTAEDKKKIEEIAKETGLPVSTIMRQALADVVVEYGK